MSLQRSFSRASLFALLALSQAGCARLAGTLNGLLDSLNLTGSSAATQLSLTGASTLGTGACSLAYTVTSRDSGGSAANVGANTTVTLSGGGSGTFYTDFTCTTSTTTLTITAGTSSTVFYFRDAAAESLTLSASATGLTAGTQALTTSVQAATHFSLTGPSTVAAGVCTSAVTVTALSASAAVSTVPATRNVNLTDGGAGGTFYATAGCGGGPVTFVSMTIGTSSQQFFYRNNTSQALTLTATDAPAVLVPPATLALTVQANAADHLTLTGASPINAGACTPYVITPRDSLNNASTYASAVTLVLSGGGAGAFYAAGDTTCAGGTISSFGLSSGAGAVTIYFRDTTPQSLTLLVQDQSAFLTQSSLPVTVQVGTPSILVFTAPSIFSANLCTAVTVSVTDSVGNASPVTGIQAVTLGTPAGGDFYTTSACTVTTSSVNIPNAASSVGTFYKVTPNAASQTLTADHGGWTQGTHSFTSIGSTHMGWTDIKALGARVVAPQSSGLTGATASVTLTWTGMTPTSGSLTGYGIYRATATGAQNFSSATGTVGPAVTTYTDTTAVSGNVYYYVVRPLVGGTPIGTPETFSEVKIPMPPNNMVLVHRWMANMEMCGIMGRATDATNDFRCAYTGTNNNGGFFNVPKSYFIDMFEAGCNYTLGVSTCSPAADCIGIGAAAGTPAANTVYQRRRPAPQGAAPNNQTCYIYAGGSWRFDHWNRTGAQTQAMVSNAPGLGPITDLTQTTAQHLCSGLPVPVPGVGATVKRLPTRREQIIAAAWEPTLSNAQINFLEGGETGYYVLPRENGYGPPYGSHVAGHCNTRNAHELTFDDNPIPADLETLPSGLTTNWANNEMVRTGSNSTAQCVSRYGAQDLVGNVFEWSSDEASDCSGPATACNGITSTVDATNTGWATSVTLNFDDVMAPKAVHNPTTLTRAWFLDLTIAPPGGYATLASFNPLNFLVTEGLPMVSTGVDGTFAIGGGTLPTSFFHGDYFYLFDSANYPPSNPERAMSSGGDWNVLATPNIANGGAAGRWAGKFDAGKDDSWPSSGFRCAVNAE